MIGGIGAHWGVTGGGTLDETEILAAIEAGHRFPDYFPVVVIARQDTDFAALLEATVRLAQGDAPYRITERPSREARYISYHVELYVGTPREALDRRLALAALPGVLMLL
jgi:hypothetical protein